MPHANDPHEPKRDPTAEPSRPPGDRPLRLEPTEKVEPLRLAGATPPPIAPPFAAIVSPQPPASAVVSPPTPPAAPPSPAAPADGRWTGEALRRVREARGLSVVQVAERTKITRHHIENIEADRYGKLPAPVYLRGILLALAKELRLDGQKVSRTYLDAVRAAAEPPR